MAVETGRCPLPELEGCGGYFRFRFRAMGTANEVMFAAPGQARARAFMEQAFEWVQAFEQACSWYREDSVLARINRSEGEWVEVEPVLEELLGLCDWYFWKTRGVFDPTSGPVNRLWDARRVSHGLPSDEEISRALSLVGWNRVEKRPGAVRLPSPGMEINLGGIGKEYAVDKVVEMARESAIEHLLVNFGQDLRVLGSAPQGGGWRIGLERPDRPGFCWGGTVLEDEALCSSGGYARFVELDGKRYPHIVHPGTGKPVDNGCLAFWVSAPTCTEAGVLSTAAYILGREAGLDLVEENTGCRGCAWDEHGITHSKGFPITYES